MKITVSITSLVILILLATVFWDCFYAIDIVPIKNNALQREKLMKIKEITNLDSLYVEFERQTESKIKARTKQSNDAINHSWQLGLAMILVILNAILIIRIRNKNAT